MKKIILSALLCVCVLQTISALENPKILTSGTLKIPLVNFYPDTDELFYTESIQPLEPYFFLKPWDHKRKIRDIRQTIYNLVHAKPLPKSSFEYPETLKYLCPLDFLENLTTAGKNVYLSVLTDYATRLTGKIDYQAQQAYAHEKIPQQVRFDLWRILAQHVFFTPEFVQKNDSNTVSKILNNTLFSVLCYDREEALLLSSVAQSEPLKTYCNNTLLTRPTDLDLLAQVLYLLTPEAPTWTVAQAEAAIGLKQLFEGKELPVKTGEKVKKSKFPEPESISDAERSSTEAVEKLVKSVENIPDVPEVTQEKPSFNPFGDLIEEKTEEKIEPPKKEPAPAEETKQISKTPEKTTETTEETTEEKPEEKIKQPKKEPKPTEETKQPSHTVEQLEQKQERTKQQEESVEETLKSIEF